MKRGEMRSSRDERGRFLSRGYRWVDERVGSTDILIALFKRPIPPGVGLWYTIGFAAVFVFVNQAVTGALLAMYYAPTPDHAYDSILYINNEVALGSVVRGLHHWGSSALLVLVVLHAIVVFVIAAYKYPREITWVLGVLLLLVVLGFSFTGYLLTWDEKAYWATAVGTNMAGTIPYVGDWMLNVMRGGSELGAMTLTRFYTLHVMVLPAALIALLAAHLFLVIRQGVSVPPGRWEVEPAVSPPEGGSVFKHEPMPLQRREEYNSRYQAFKRRGRPFWPDIIVEDALVALAVFLGLLLLTVLWEVPLEARADPTNTAYVPRPEWYFMFAFQLLKVFPGYLEWVGIAVVPTVGLLVLALLPFYDRHPRRRPLVRPVALASGGVAMAAIVVLTIVAFATTPSSSAEVGRQRLTTPQIAGRLLFEANCTACHSLGGKGGTSAPPLDGITNRMDHAFVHEYIEDPRSINPDAVMPPFLRYPDVNKLGHVDTEYIVEYLEAFRAQGE
ncbi:MAG: cytochrome b N-terminal domain-containing protein [Dehalococcoidia bacterium]